MASVKMSRPRKFVGPKSSYIKVNHAGKVENVILDEAVLADWDSLDELTIDSVSYDRRTPAADGSEADKVGEDGFVHETWSRLEIIDYTTINDIKRQTAIEEVKAERDFVRVKVARKYTLTDETLKELENAI